MAAKHFLIYYLKGSGTFVVTEPRPWARENQHHFPDFTFGSDNHPTTDFIESWLIENKKFKKVVDSPNIVVVQNLDPNLIL
jgi:hypothetical protein